MIVVRRVERSDAAVLREIRLNALRDTPMAFASTYDAELALTDSDWDARAQAGSQGHERATFLAEVAGHVSGLAGGWRLPPSAPHVELVSLWVAPDARRSGVAHALVEAVLYWAVSVQATEVSLWATEGNVGALTFYEAMGFEPTGATQPLPSDPSRREIKLGLTLT